MITVTASVISKQKYVANMGIGEVRHALCDAVARVEGVGREGSGQLPEVVGLVDCCVQQAAGSGVKVNENVSGRVPRCNKALGIRGEGGGGTCAGLGVSNR